MNLSIDLISKYRSQIMGFAILWVMTSHVPVGGDCLKTHSSQNESIKLSYNRNKYLKAS